MIKVNKLKSGIYAVLGSPTTLIVQDSGIVYVIDAGINRERALSIREYVLSRLGSNIKLLFSHAHPDHICAADIFEAPSYINKKEYSVAASRVLRECLEFGARAPKGFYSLSCGNLEISGTFDDFFKVGSIEGIPLPGHSPGHTGFAVRGMLYAADTIFGDRLLNRVGIPFLPDHTTALNSMNKLYDFVDQGFTLVLSHGPLVKGDKARSLISMNIERVSKCRKLILEYLIKPRTVTELTYLVSTDLGVELTPELISLNEVTIKSLLSELSDEGIVEADLSDRGLIWFKRK